jgi:hypothetical protein
MRKDRPGSDGTPKTVPNLPQSVGNATLGPASDGLPEHRLADKHTKFALQIAECEPSPPRNAKRKQIRDEIQALYDAKEGAREKMPNINETAKEVRERLEQRNLKATKTLIKEIADQAEFQNRRGPVGVRRSNKGLPRQRRSK